MGWCQGCQWGGIYGSPKQVVFGSRSVPRIGTRWLLYTRPYMRHQWHAIYKKLPTYLPSLLESSPALLGSSSLLARHRFTSSEPKRVGHSCPPKRVCCFAHHRLARGPSLSGRRWRPKRQRKLSRRNLSRRNLCRVVCRNKVDGSAGNVGFVGGFGVKVPNNYLL